MLFITGGITQIYLLSFITVMKEAYLLIMQFPGHTFRERGKLNLGYQRN